MKKILTFLFAFLASIGLMNAKQVTMTWELAGDLTGTSSDPGITLSNVTYGNNLTNHGIKTYTGEGTGTLFSPTTDLTEHETAVKSGDNTLTFAFSIPEGYLFRPSNLSFFSAKDGSGNNHFLDAYFKDGSRFITTYSMGRGSQGAETKSVALSDIELTGDDTLKFDLYGKSTSASKGWVIGSVVITGDLVNLSDTRENANISWSVESTNLKIRDSFTAPVLNNPDNVPVTFSTSNKEVAVVDEAGKITLVDGGVGTAIISATYDGEAEGAQYMSTTANTTIEVVTNVTDVKEWKEYEKVESIPLTKLYTADKTSGTLAAGNLIDDDFINIKTVYSANYTKYDIEYLGNKFSGAVQLGRVKTAPSEDNKYGTEDSGNSPIIVTPKKDCKVVMFIRRQSLAQDTTIVDDVENNIITRTIHMGMSPNDGKSIYAAPHSAIGTKIDQNLVFGAPTDNTSYMYCAVEWDMKAGETYTLYALNTTIAMQGIGYYLETGDYTLRYVADGKTIKEVTKSGVAGTDITLTDEEKADFTLTEGDVATKYTYVSDDSEGKTINSDEVTVVTINMLGTAAKEPNVLYSWDFTTWSDETVNNLKAGDNWSDDEKGNGTTVDSNCFWQVDLSADLSSDKYLMANGVVIEELEGLVYKNTTNKRNLAIAVNYPEALSTYEGGAYLWLGGGAADYFIIPGVPAGSTIKMGVESHKTTDARGVELSIAGEKLNAPNGSAVAVPTTYTNQEWFVPTTAAESNDVLIRNTNGCHIYYITITHPDLQKYTLKYVAGDETIKKVTRTGYPEASIALTEEDTADFTITENGFSTTYTCDSNDSEGKKIAEDGSTVVTITMLKGLTIPTGWMAMPGVLDIAHSSWNYDGLKLENNNTNVGYAKDGTSATGEVYVTEAGVYSMNIDFYSFYNASDFQVEITDQATGNKEVDTYYHISEKGEANILLEGELTAGKKTIKYTFHSDSDGFLANYKNQTLTKAGETYSALKSITAEGTETAETEGYDYTFNIPMNYEGETVTLTAELLNATLSVKAGETEIKVSEEGTFELPVPAPNEASETVLTLNLEEGAVAGQTEFKLRLFHVDGVMLTGLTIDGLVADEETVAELQDKKKDVTIDDYIFTTLPTVKATFKDGKVVEATGTLADDNTTATYTFKGVAGDKTEDYSFTLSGFHIYQDSEKDKTDILKYNKEYNGKGEDGSWSDGKYSITANDGWDGKQFKMNSANPVTLTAPSYMRIKQIKIASLYDNYKPGKVASVTSEGATVYLPSASEFVETGADQAINLVINVENHKEGTPFVITFEGGSQPVAWFEFIYESLYKDVTGITLSKEAAVEHGETITLNAKVSPSDATDPTITWISNNPEVATVENGVVTAVSVGKATITAKAGDKSAECVVKCYPKKGDATWSGDITVSDAVDITNYVVGKKTADEAWDADEWLEFYKKGANVNEDEDENITFADASAAVKLALDKPTATPEQSRISAISDDAADALVISGAAGNAIPVRLDNSMEYVALQADIILPEGMNVDVKAGDRVADSHTMMTKKFADNHIRVAFFNFGNEAFADNDAPILEILTDSDILNSGDIVIFNILASDTNANEYVLTSRISATSAVAAIGFDANAPVKVFDLNGIYVSDTMEGLGQGTYIVRQGDEAKKVRIR